MSDELFEQLVRKYPHLFEKSQCNYFSIGSGWYTIVDTLCELLSADVEAAASRLRYARENPDKLNKSIGDLETILQTAIDQLPVIVQVKEKFGSLRIYADGVSDTAAHYIEFAESISTHTCEECGAPGGRSGGSWIKTLCDKHQLAREERNAATQHLYGKPPMLSSPMPGPLLSDED